MEKTAFIFPGQGAQKVNMGRSFYDNCECSRRIYEQAETYTGLDLKKLIFTENKHLDQTMYTQIALYTTEVAMLRAITEAGFTADVTAGLSLGEYSALTASKALDFEDGCRIVQQRGKLMEQAVPAGEGAMAAVLGLSTEQVDQVLLEERRESVCVANYNCPGQVVISGKTEDILYLMEKMKEAGAKRVIRLQVSGPFHSPLLKEAGSKLGQVLEKVTFDQIQIPYVSNLTAEYIYDHSKIKNLLERQVSGSVRWEQSIRKMIEDDVTTFVEVGPGRTLNGFVKKIAKEMQVEQPRLIQIEEVMDLNNIN